MSKDKPYTVASFFSGCGGFDHGFEKNDFSVLFGNDSWEDAATTFRANYPQVKFFEKPIQDITEEELAEVTNNMQVDVLIGGPPCQCFTRLNNNHLIKLSELKKEDNRRTLSQEYIKKVKLLKPKIVLMENVRDLLHRKNQEGKLYSEIIREAFKEIGYETYCKIISMDKYDVPQKRKRVIFLATNVKRLMEFLDENVDNGFPKESNRIITSGEALAKIKDNESLSNHNFTINEPETLEKIRNIPPGGYYEDLPDSLKTKKIRNGKEVIVKRYGSYYRRLHPDEPSRTITNNYVIHPIKDRYLSNREMAILHSFPKQYKFKGNMGSVSQQIANAVPPKFAEKMAKRVQFLLDNYC
ncbi:DNA cytosine methyltransferase [archaeon]|jgi:DNA (cytosine-5)-methyltransferase 1|nr:DNA cytosine methyltransferase [archaeon]MBT3578136.1 DNA cytosine methyltransferase [archaeon]MBT6820684.1 DNA cytosine methyltransferase [archaeon]MBT7024906.1 DNA cytosine methyltransferase [archaeon]MBT7238525.1 DNA cytosine methyltransferase [archaeon]